jgi:hypothetical protein
MIAPAPVAAVHDHPRAATRARVLSGLGEVESSRWDDLVPPGAAGFTHSFLQAWEQAELPGRSARPIVVPVRGGGGLAAAAAAYHYDLDLATVSIPILPGPVRMIRRFWARYMTLRVYELGAPAARHAPVLVAPGVEAAEVAERIIAAAVREAEAAQSPMIVVQDFVRDGGPLAAALSRHGFGRVEALPSFVVDVRFSSFDEYLQAMRSKYRRRARCVLRDSAHLRAELVGDFGPLAGELAGLWRLVYERARETRREVLGADYFRAAAELEGMQALILRRPDGSVAIFGLLLEDGDWLHFLQCGFAEEAARREAAYFRLLLEIVRAAIERSFTVAHLGCTTAGPKLDVGARPVALSAWLRHRNPLVQRLFVTGGNGRFAPAAAPARHVFASSHG